MFYRILNIPLTRAYTLLSRKRQLFRKLLLSPGYLDYQRAGDQEREGMQRQKRKSQQTVMQLWVRVLVPNSRDTHSLFELFIVIKPPTNGR